MRRNVSQIAIAIVCVFLGFILTYEFKRLNRDDSFSSTNNYAKGSEISEELEAVKKQRLELRIKNNELFSQLKKYEENISNQEEIRSEITKEIRNSNILLGSTAIEGEGISVILTPTGTTLVEESVNNYITDEDLLNIINELKFAGAEAIAINDKRITSQSGIKSSENNSYILINDEKISPRLKIEIKAIGDKVKLQSALAFADTYALSVVDSDFYDTTISPMDSIKIPRYNRLYKTSHLKRKE